MYICTVYICMYVVTTCMYVCTYMYMYVHMYQYSRLYVCTCVCTCVCTGMLHVSFVSFYSREHRSNHIRPSSAGVSGGSGTNDSGSSSRKFSRPPGDEVYVRNYRLLKTIGKGNFAKVKLARHMPTGVEVS